MVIEWKNCAKCGLCMPMGKTQKIYDLCKNAKRKQTQGLEKWIFNEGREGESK